MLQAIEFLKDALFAALCLAAQLLYSQIDLLSLRYQCVELVSFLIPLPFDDIELFS